MEATLKEVGALAGEAIHRVAEITAGAAILKEAEISEGAGDSPAPQVCF